MSKVLYVLGALLVLMFMILVHELGHYTVGKLLGFKINEFAIGMGPKLFSHKKKNGEVVSLRLLPLGGFCAFEGEDGTSDNPDAFSHQKPWKRILVLLAGVTFNFLSALIIAVIVFSCFGDTVVKINEIYDYAPQSNRQLQSGDVIYKINGHEVYIAGDLQHYMKGDEFDVTVLRGGEEVVVKDVKKQTYVTWQIATVQGSIYDDTGNRKLLGGDSVYSVDGIAIEGEKAFENATKDKFFVSVVVSDEQGERYTYSLEQVDLQKITVDQTSYTGVGMSIGYDTLRYSFGKALLRAFPYCVEVAWLVLRTLGGLITGAVGLSAVGGPITTIKVASEVVSSGFANVLSLIVLISVNLAAFNLLPIPSLDGCQIVFVLIEMIRCKPINPKVQSYINGIGLILLIAFVVLVDLLKL